LLAPNPHHRPRKRPGKPVRPLKAIGRLGKVYGVFPHAGTAAAVLGVCRNSIINALRGGTRSAGYYWRYVGTPDELQPLNPNVLANHGARRTIPEAFRPRPVVVAIPSNKYTARKPSQVQVEYVPDAPSPRPAVAKVIATDGSNPARAGMDAAAFAVAQERGRFEKARAYNPALTWEGWITVAGKKRGRPPRRDSGAAAKGVGL
jgi:hypothetical protein